MGNFVTFILKELWDTCSTQHSLLSDVIYGYIYKIKYNLKKGFYYSKCA